MLGQEITLLDALRRVPLFAHFKDEGSCQQLLTQGVAVSRAAGDVLVRQGEPVSYFFILLEGRLQLSKQIGGQDVPLNTYGPGTFFGEVPLLMDTGYLVTGRAVTDCRLFGVPREGFWFLLANCQDFRRAVLKTMAQRVHDLEAVAQGRERLAALGTLAAGLAHELNNPAAAGRRAAGQLRTAVTELTPPPLPAETLADLRLGAIGPVGAAPDTVARAENEEALADALTAVGVADGWEFAAAFAEASLTPEWVGQVAARVPEVQRATTFAWLCGLLTTQALLDEVEQSVERVSDLVEAMKGYSYLDQAPVQEIDVHDGLDDTLVVMRARIEAANVCITRDYDRTLPRFQAWGSALNQVWTGLLENALDAAGGGGEIRLRTVREPECALIEIADNGPGIPPEVQAHIFEPFFTTKEVGQGRGLGLDAAYRAVVHLHGGDLRALSQPGDTRFQVRLPLGK